MRDLRILRWFSNGYYNVVHDENGHLVMNDLRFGLTSEDYRGLESYIFSWELKPEINQNGKLAAHQNRKQRGDASKMFSELWARIKGK